MFSAEEQKFMDIIEKSSHGEENKNEGDKAKIPASASFSFDKEVAVEAEVVESPKGDEKDEEKGE